MNDDTYIKQVRTIRELVNSGSEANIALARELSQGLADASGEENDFHLMLHNCPKCTPEHTCQEPPLRGLGEFYEDSLEHNTLLWNLPYTTDDVFLPTRIGIKHCLKCDGNIWNFSLIVAMGISGEAKINTLLKPKDMIPSSSIFAMEKWLNEDSINTIPFPSLIKDLIDLPQKRPPVVSIVPELSKQDFIEYLYEIQNVPLADRTLDPVSFRRCGVSDEMLIAYIVERLPETRKAKPVKPQHVPFYKGLYKGRNKY